MRCSWRLLFVAVAVLFCSPLTGAISWTETDQQVLPATDAGSVQADYHFINLGATALTITVATSCNCTIASSDRTVYGPGERGCVHALMHLGERTGMQVKDVEVSFSDGETQLLILRTIAPPIFTISDHFLRWDCGSPLTERTVRIEVAPPYQLHALHPRAARTVSLAIREIVPGRIYDVVATPHSTQEPHLEYVDIETDHPVRERSTIKLFVDIEPAPEPQAPVAQAPVSHVPVASSAH